MTHSTDQMHVPTDGDGQDNTGELFLDISWSDFMDILIELLDLPRHLPKPGSPCKYPLSSRHSAKKRATGCGRKRKDNQKLRPKK